MRLTNRVSMVATLVSGTMCVACGTSVEVPDESGSGDRGITTSPPHDETTGTEGYGVGQPECTVTSVGGHNEEDLRERGDLHPDPDEAATAFVDETLAHLTTTPEIRELVEEGESILGRVDDGDALSTADVMRGDDGALNAAAEVIALKALDHALDDGTVRVETDTTAGRSTFETPPGEVGGSISVVRAVGEPEGWYVDGHGWELPGSECEPRPDE